MEAPIMGKRLAEYNSMIKEHEDLYRQTARRFGLSECAFWILYSLREEPSALTQSQICYALSQPKQTIHSALKKLENDGYIELVSVQDRRRKEIQLTKEGNELAMQTVDKVIMLENQAFDAFTVEEQELFLRLFHKYTDHLKDNLSERNLK